MARSEARGPQPLTRIGVHDTYGRIHWCDRGEVRKTQDQYRKDFFGGVSFVMMTKSTSASRYYNQTRTHLSLDKDAPLGRSIQRWGAIVAVPVLSGLHHCYSRI